MRFQQFLERKGEKAHREAIAMGLQYKGFGYWADPNTGVAKYKTVNDQLVPVEPDVESDLYKGDEKDEAPAMSGTPQQGGMAQPGADAAPQPRIGSGQGIEGGLGVDARAPQKKGWDAGPDGDTCVGGQPREDIPVDAFVGKTNNLKWTAGPDGSNAMELGEMRQIIEGSFTKEINRKKAADQKINDILAGNDRSIPNTETAGKLKRMVDRGEVGSDVADALGYEPRPKTVPPGPEQGPKRPLNRPGPGTMMRAAMGAGEVPGDWKDEIQPARDAVEKAKKGGNDLALGNQIAKMMAIRNDDKRKPEGLDGTFINDEQKRVDMFKQILKLPAELKDGEAVKGLNEAIKGLIKDPEFDLDQFDGDDEDDNFIDEGAFGSVFDAGDAVIKKGRLGPKEIQALYAMRDSPFFPDLINARFDGPFKHQSAVYNNPLGKSEMGRGRDGQAPDDYWDPDDQSEWEDRFPTAEGTYAMSKAKGGPLYDMFDELDEDAQQNAIRQFWQARGDLHKAGFSHNDMHNGNIFVDEDGNLQIIDMGLANDNPLSALMEGIGGLDFEEGEDFQLGNIVGGSGIPENIRDRMTENLEGVREMLQDNISLEGSDYDDYDEDEDYSSQMSDATEMLEAMMYGGIRLTKDELGEIGDRIPFLQDKGNIMKLIDRLYQGLGQDDNFEEEKPKPEIGGFEAALDRLRGLGKAGRGQTSSMQRALGSRLDPDD